MLVFGRLKCRKLQIPSIKNNAKDDATGVFYTSGVCSGANLFPHTFSDLYTFRVGISLLVYTQWFFLQPQTTDG